MERPESRLFDRFFGVDQCGGRLCVLSLWVLPVRCVGVGARQVRSLAGSGAVPGVVGSLGLGGFPCGLAGVVVSPLVVVEGSG